MLPLFQVFQAPTSTNPWPWHVNIYPSYIDPYASYEAQVLDISSWDPSQELFTLGGGLIRHLSL